MATKPKHFPKKRNLEDLWLQVFPVGTEWEYFEAVYQYKWNFSNLEEALEEGGELHNKEVYLFGCTEPQFVPYKDESKPTLVPVVVAVVSPFPPSDKIAITRKVTEEIVPMKQMKMDWVPYVPREYRESQVKRLKDSQIFVLSCKQRRAALSCLEIDRVKKFESCIPYFCNPLQENELEQSTVVKLVLRSDPNPVVTMFDWKRNDIEEFTDKLIELEELPANQKGSFMNQVRDKIREAGKPICEAWESVKKAQDELEQQSKAAFEKMHYVSFLKLDLEPDMIEGFTDLLIKKGELPADQKEPLMNYIREAAKANHKLKESRKKAQGELDQQPKAAAFKNMKFYKFYPVTTPDTPDVSGVKCSYINRYYGKAHKVM